MTIQQFAGQISGIAVLTLCSCGGGWRPPSIVRATATSAVATEQHADINVVLADNAPLTLADVTVSEDGASRKVLRLETAAPPKVWQSASTVPDILAACDAIVATHAEPAVVLLTAGFEARPDHAAEQQVSEALRRAHAAIWLVASDFVPFGTEETASTHTTHSGETIVTSDVFRESPTSREESRGFEAAKSLAAASGGRWLDHAHTPALHAMLAAEYRITYQRPPGTKAPETLTIKVARFHASVAAPSWVPQ